MLVADRPDEESEPEAVIRPNDSWQSQESIQWARAGEATLSDVRGTSMSDMSTLPPSVGASSARGSGESGSEKRVSLRQNKYVYEVWSDLGGTNRFRCRGRCITGPAIDIWYNCCAWSCILVPCIFFFSVCTRCLWTLALSYKVLVVATAVVMLLTVIFLLLTSYTDPGIIPRRSLQLAIEGLEAEVCELTGCPPVVVDPSTGEAIPSLTEEQHAEGYRWCPTCKIIRPPRASHCRDCNNCVLVHDHHCPFVSNCVGNRNYSFFWSFLVSTACLGLAVVVGIAVYFYYFGEVFSTDCEQKRVMSEGPWEWVIIGIIGMPTAAVLVLLIFHAILTAMGSTTRECLRPTARSLHFGESILFAARKPSMVHARDRVSYPMTLV